MGGIVWGPASDSMKTKEWMPENKRDRDGFFVSIGPLTHAWLLVHQLVYWGDNNEMRLLHSELLTCQIGSRWTKGARRSCLPTPRLRTWTRSLNLQKAGMAMSFLSLSATSCPSRPASSACTARPSRCAPSSSPPSSGTASPTRCATRPGCGWPRSPASSGSPSRGCSPSSPSSPRPTASRASAGSRRGTARSRWRAWTCS
ncbi:hypothetical protein GQ55_4G092600 [Panicum hallii var. hallii]|uniref:Uncharacterized protein n=1 Tax=Panicum hallii var. hallii TaxID=1504633 RepID=A0A2T7DWU9_9POAL|nr:hypothetical protein GQ55_4G092600 [Panicum hallii var. hallii]